MDTRTEGWWKSFIRNVKESHRSGLLEKLTGYALLVAIAVLEILVHIFPPGIFRPVISVLGFLLLVITFNLLVELASKDRKIPSVFPDLLAAYPAIKANIENAQRRSRKGVITHVDFITSTASTALTHLKISEKDMENIEFRIALLDPDLSPARTVARTWPDEIRSSIQYINYLANQEDLKKRHVGFDFRTYYSLPCLQGALIADRFLYLGHYHWREGSHPHAIQLGGPENPYWYYDGNNPEDKPYVDLFKGWFRYYWEALPFAPREMWIVGHRGSRQDEVENTISTFRRGVELGANWIELDVRAASDALVVYHDDHLDGRPIREQKLDELRQFRYPNSQEGIPTLAEAIESIDPRVGLGIEIKEVDVVPQLARALEPFRGRRRIVVSSLHRKVLVQLKRLCPLLRVGLLKDTPPGDVLGEMDDVGAEALFPKVEHVTEELVKIVQDAGLKICPWTVNDPEEIRRLVRLGVDGIITDYPERVREVLKGGYLPVSPYRGL